MDRVEYRIAELKLETSDNIEELTRKLNELGGEGWHVRSVDLTGHPSFAARKLPVLLEREVPAIGHEMAGAGRELASAGATRSV